MKKYIFNSELIEGVTKRKKQLPTLLPLLTPIYSQQHNIILWKKSTVF